MTEDTHKRLSSAVRHLLKPLMRIVLRNGVSYQEFSDWVKLSAVDVAIDQLATGGKRPSDSQVAILTGLTRKEIKRLRDDCDGAEPEIQTELHSKANRATRVLSGWYRDPDFCDQAGKPKILSATDKESGFPALVRRYSGDMPPRAMLDELLRVNAISKSKHGIRALSRSYVPDSDDEQGIRLLGTALHDLTATIDHNLTAGDEQPPRFQRSAVNTKVSQHQLNILRRIVADRGLDLLQMVDDWMSDHESDDGDGHRAGIGIYYFESDEPVEERRVEEKPVEEKQE